MRKILLCMSFCILLFSSLPVYAAQVEPLQGDAVITSNKLNVRSGPSQEYEILGTLDKDQIVEITGIVEPDWYVIEYNGSEGYIFGDYLIFTPAPEVAVEEESEKGIQIYLIFGISLVILVVVGFMVYTIKSMREDTEEEEDIPLSDHDDTNMHLGEVTYDTYRLDIDPGFFETTTLVPQPESIYEDEIIAITDSDKDTDEGIRQDTSNMSTIDSRLELASAQLAALQKEVEELKKQKTKA